MCVCIAEVSMELDSWNNRGGWWKHRTSQYKGKFRDFLRRAHCGDIAW